MYYTDLSAYTYALPCGATFRSLTPSVAVSGEAGEPEAGDEGLGAVLASQTPGAHWFPCSRCRTTHVVEEADLDETKPRGPKRAQGDGQLARKIDGAIHADRVAERYRAVWNTETRAQVAAITGCSPKCVLRVSLALGIYEEDDFGLAA